MDKQEINELSLYLKSLPRLADKGKKQRIDKAKNDFFSFIKTYFPHHIDHAEVETSHFRQWVHKNLLSTTHAHKKTLYSAYRGAAKTTTITQLFTLWRVANQDVNLGIIISATDKAVGSIFEMLKTELEDNANFLHDFDIGRPSIWREKEIVIKVGQHLCKLMGFGAGVKIRGLKFLSKRPDLIIADDIEDDEKVESKQQRNKLYNWFVKAVMKLPARKGKYRLIVVGTVLHNDGLLKRLEQRDDFKCYSFPLVIRFPTDIDNKDSIQGLVLDDPEIDGVEVMQEYYEDIDSFMSEYQNQPISKEGLLIDHYELVDIMPKCDVYYMGLDPAMGKKKGDYFGVAVIGKKGDKFYATVKGYRMSPVKLIPRIIATYERYSKIAPTTMAVETVQFQEFFKDVLKKEATAIGVTLAVKELRNTAPKALRIDSIAPLINDGTILIYAKDHLLIEELETYPSAAHDDLLDSLEMAYRIYKTASTMNYKDVREKIKKRKFNTFKDKYA